MIPCWIRLLDLCLDFGERHGRVEVYRVDFASGRLRSQVLFSFWTAMFRKIQSIRHDDTLPENTQMPSVYGFAECQTTGTRQTCGTRHAHTLPSAGRRQRTALGIPRLCRVPEGEHSAKTGHVPSTCAHRAPAIKLADGC